MRWIVIFFWHWSHHMVQVNGECPWRQYDTGLSHSLKVLKWEFSGNWQSCRDVECRLVTIEPPRWLNFSRPRRERNKWTESFGRRKKQRSGENPWRNMQGSLSFSERIDLPLSAKESEGSKRLLTAQETRPRRKDSGHYRILGIRRWEMPDQDITGLSWPRVSSGSIFSRCGSRP